MAMDTRACPRGGGARSFSPTPTASSSCAPSWSMTMPDLGRPPRPMCRDGLGREACWTFRAGTDRPHRPAVPSRALVETPASGGVAAPVPTAPARSDFARRDKVCPSQTAGAPSAAPPLAWGPSPPSPPGRAAPPDHRSLHRCPRPRLRRPHPQHPGPRPSSSQPPPNSGTASRGARPATTGTPTRATAARADCSSARRRGWLTGAASSPREPTRPAASSRSLSRTGFEPSRAGRPGRAARTASHRGDRPRRPIRTPRPTSRRRAVAERRRRSCRGCRARGWRST